MSWQIIMKLVYLGVSERTVYTEMQDQYKSYYIYPYALHLYHTIAVMKVHSGYSHESFHFCLHRTESIGLIKIHEILKYSIHMLRDPYLFINSRKLIFWYLMCISWNLYFIKVSFYENFQPTSAKELSTVLQAACGKPPFSRPALVPEIRAQKTSIKKLIILKAEE